MSSRKGSGRNAHLEANSERKRLKREAARRRHADKYAHRVMESRLAQLVAHFNGEEADDE